MPHTVRRKLIITGTGRAGTTFLVQLLTEFGLETGFERGLWGDAYHEHCRAGLEHDLRDPAAPYVVKNPDLCETLAATLAEGDVVIDHALVPIRPLNDAAQSRIRVGGSGKTPGGLTGTAVEAEQQRVLAERFHRLIHTLAAHQVPTTFLEFPRFAQDAAYTFAALRAILPRELSWPEFSAAFERTARPDLIHRFDGRRPADAGAPAKAHAAVQRAAKSAQHRRRWVAVAAAVTALGFAGWIRAGRNDPDVALNAPAETANAELAANATRPAAQEIDDSSDADTANSGGLYVDRDPRLPSQLRRSSGPSLPRMPMVRPRTLARKTSEPRWL